MPSSSRDSKVASSKNRYSKGIRWWPLGVIAGLAIIAAMVVWLPDAPNRQNQVQQTFLIIFGTVLLTILWLMFFSRMRWIMRFLALGVIIALGYASTFLIKIKGVSGDLIPVLQWRWAEGAGELQTGGKAISPGVDGIHFSPTDYPQFLGPNRNAVLKNVGLSPEWDRRPPQEIWRQPIGEGWSAYAVVGTVAITQEQRGEKEMVVCYNLKTGKALWSHGDEAFFESTIGGNGPRSTPTVGLGRVYTTGSTGVLNCLDFATGKQIWTRNIIEENGANAKEWGFSGSPLILDTLVVVSPGGPDGRSLVAYHWDSGEMVWSGGSDPAGHSSPQLSTLFDTPQILILNTGSVAAHNPANGEIFWRQEWDATSQFVAQPVVVPGNRVFVSLGYGIGCKLFQINRNENGDYSSSELWKSPRMKAKFTNVVYHDNHIYGLDDGVLACISVEDGQRKWKKGRYGHGQLIMVDDLLLIQAEKGDVALVEVNPDKYNEVARMKALSSKTWNNPTLSKPYLLVRNDQEAICYELPLESE